MEQLESQPLEVPALWLLADRTTQLSSAEGAKHRPRVQQTPNARSLALVDDPAHLPGTCGVLGRLGVAVLARASARVRISELTSGMHCRKGSMVCNVVDAPT